MKRPLVLAIAAVGGLGVLVAGFARVLSANPAAALSDLDLRVAAEIHGSVAAIALPTAGALGLGGASAAEWARWMAAHRRWEKQQQQRMEADTLRYPVCKGDCLPEFAMPPVRYLESPDGPIGGAMALAPVEVYTAVLTEESSGFWLPGLLVPLVGAAGYLTFSNGDDHGRPGGGGGGGGGGETVIPEPMSLLLLGTGLSGLAAVRRRRRT